MHDLVIRGGTVVDGTGAAEPHGRRRRHRRHRSPRSAGCDGPARRDLDADGLLVTPGFVDIHTHFDGQATWDPHLTPSCWHGVTTAIAGQLRRRLRARAPRRAGPAHRADGRASRTSPARRWPRASGGTGRPSPSTSTRSDRDASRPRHRHPGAPRRRPGLRHGRPGPRGATADDLVRHARHRARRGSRPVPSASRPGAPPATATSTASRCRAPSRRRTSSARSWRSMDEVGAGVLQLVPAGRRRRDRRRRRRRHGGRAGVDPPPRPGPPPAHHVPGHGDGAEPDLWRRWFDAARPGQRRRGADIRPQVGNRCFGMLHGAPVEAQPAPVPAHLPRRVAHLPLADRVRALRDPEVRGPHPGRAGRASPARPASTSSVDGLSKRSSRWARGSTTSRAATPASRPSPGAQGRDPWEVAYDLLLGADGRDFLLHPLLNYGRRLLRRPARHDVGPDHRAGPRRRRRPLRDRLRRQHDAPTCSATGPATGPRAAARRSSTPSAGSPATPPSCTGSATAACSPRDAGRRQRHRLRALAPAPPRAGPRPARRGRPLVQRATGYVETFVAGRRSWPTASSPTSAPAASSAARSLASPADGRARPGR